MFAISKAENTTCNPTRHNLTNSENHGVCIGSYGVLQVGCLHYKSTDDINNLETNVRIAKQVFDNRQKWGSGYQAWSMYNNGIYKKYL